MIKPVVEELFKDSNDRDNDDTRGTIHDCTYSLAFMANESISYSIFQNESMLQVPHAVHSPLSTDILDKAVINF